MFKYCAFYLSFKMGNSGCKKSPTLFGDCVIKKPRGTLLTFEIIHTFHILMSNTRVRFLSSMCSYMLS